MELNLREKELLRELAKQYMEIAVLPEQSQKRELWKALNRSNMERPMVVIDQLPWNELNTDGSLTCQVADPFWRRVEYALRRTLYQWRHFPVDMVVEPILYIPMAISGTGYGVEIQQQTRATEAGNSVVSHQYINQFETEEDLEKISDMHFTLDREETQRRWEMARELFDGIAPVRLSSQNTFHLGIWDRISMLMGVENAYIDLMDRPEFIHQILQRFTRSVINGIRECNALGIHDDTANTCHCSYVYTDQLLPDFGQGKGPQSQNCWAYGMAQLFSSVSPAITKEFELPYISRMAEHFGMIYYGCCDRLDDRLEMVKTIPHLKKISCSPWSDRDAFAEKIGPSLIMSAKPNPALIAGAQVDEEAVRRDLRHTLDSARRNGVNLEIILKDISTVQHQPQRLTRWAEIAMEEVCR